MLYKKKRPSESLHKYLLYLKFKGDGGVRHFKLFILLLEAWITLAEVQREKKSNRLLIYLQLVMQAQTQNTFFLSKKKKLDLSGHIEI